MKRLKYILYFLPVLLIISSCVRDELIECPADVRIYFSYRPASYAAKVGIDPEDVDKLSLFVFDEEGYFVTIIEDHNPQLSIDYYMGVSGLDAGLYQMIVWGGITDQLSFSKTPETGYTNLKDLQLLFNTDEDNIITGTYSPLFFADKASGYVRVYNNNQASDTLHLVQNSYIINVKVNGLSSLESDSCLLTITDSKSVLNFDNTIPRSTPVTYKTGLKKENNIYTSSITMLRLTEQSDTWLSLERESLDEPLYACDLLELIMSIEKEGGEVDLSYMHEFNIEITVSGVDVNVKVNGWTVVKSGDDLHG